MKTVEEILEHHGIKGQKWGVRRDPRTGVRPIAKTLDESRFGRFANKNAERSMARSNKRRGIETKSRVKTGRPASADSRKVSELKKKKPSQLTNKQLKAVQERHNLERSFKQANPAKIEKGHAFAKSVLALGSTGAALFALAKSPAGQATIKLGKAFIDVRLSGKFVNSNKIDVSKFQRSVQGTLF